MIVEGLLDSLLPRLHLLYLGYGYRLQSTCPCCTIP